jgi:hypothetical protein
VELRSDDPVGTPLTGHTGAVRAGGPSASPTARPIAVSGGDDTVRVSDVATGGSPRVIRLGVQVLSVTKLWDSTSRGGIPLWLAASWRNSTFVAESRPNGCDGLRSAGFCQVGDSSPG